MELVEGFKGSISEIANVFISVSWCAPQTEISDQAAGGRVALWVIQAPGFGKNNKVYMCGSLGSILSAVRPESDSALGL